MDNNEYLDNFQQTLSQSIAAFLRSRGEIDGRLPDAPDIEDKWEEIAKSYLPDGVREFSGYPMSALGWMMFVGMAVAKFWDEDWERYSKVEDLYLLLREPRGYDCMDEYICEEILCLDAEELKSATSTSDLVADVAQMAHRSLKGEGFEPGTSSAFLAFVRTLHEMYYFGAAIQLFRMGYRMTKI